MVQRSHPSLLVFGKQERENLDPLSSSLDSFECWMDTLMVLGFTATKERIQNLTAKPLKIQPAVKQVEINYWFLRPELLEWSKKSGILLEAYSPLGSSKRASDTQHSCGLHMKPMALALTMSVR
ncbi:aldo-keto reductase [Moniliophthora roreri MCA 2997]|uniref:Aldo-keto reductase n=1 Tax=Moniliophthora roreri (strain MCA 2997) TaxID=1381753 RepID=V2XZG0_MONRO|nr:aldo-keto reductase [Moniliophthora roreri MCA 2997]